ncbi:MAG: sulfotransferase [Gemmataceae bacterium]
MENTKEWAPRLWQGCTLPAFLRLLWKNHFAVDPRFFYMPLVMTTVGAVNSALQVVQESWYGSRLDRTPIREPPLFIIGHWRTGTTLLHELLALDPRFTSPTTYQCFAPHHFLLTEPLAELCLRWMLPSHRPMDNMAVGWSRPQEDEFALAMLGQPSPYLTIAFPNRPPQGGESLELERLPREKREAWKRAFVGFLEGE